MPLLQVESVSIRFGGLQALSDVTFMCEPGQITGLIGPNGAGKTTTFNAICGLNNPTSGSITFDGHDVSGMKPHQRARLGIGRTFQRLEVFGTLSAYENILVASEIRRRWGAEKFDPREATEEILDRVGIRSVADERVDAMPTGLARLVELGRALATRPKIMLLDEVSSGLSEGEESELMAELLMRLAREGLAILLVEHDMELVMRICGQIHVLDFGRIIASGIPEEIQKSEVVQAAYLGEDDAA